jgi:hypothetical protein
LIEDFHSTADSREAGDTENFLDHGDVFMARKRLTSLPDGLWTKLAELEAYVRTLDLIRGLGWTLAVAAVSVAAAIVIDICVDLSISLRIGLLVAAATLTCFAFLMQVWRPFRKQRSVVDLAATVERANPQLKESLVSCIELYDSSIPEAERGSPLMRELAARQALHSAAPIDFCAAVSPRPAHRMLVGSAVAWSLLLLPLAVPSSYRLLVARFFTPWQNHDRVASFWFDVDRGDRIVVRGSDVTIVARARGEEQSLPKTATLNWTDSSGEADSRKLDLDPTTGLYTTTIPHVMQGFEYQLTGGGNRSRRYQIDVVDAPAVTSFQLEVQPPAYTGRPATSLDGPAGEIPVFERSQLKWKLTFNKPLKSAAIVWLKDATHKDAQHQDSSRVEAPSEPGSADHQDQAKLEAGPANSDDSESVAMQLAADGLSAELESLTEQHGRFRFVVRDEFDLTNETEILRHLVVTLDQPPVLTLAGSGSEGARPSDTISIPVQATDDVGLAALELHYEVDQTRQGIAHCPVAELGKLETRHTFSLPMSNLHVKDGELVSYRVRAADERPEPGPNETWSDRFVIRIDSKAKPPGTTELAAEQKQLQDQLKQLNKETNENKKQIEFLKQQARLEAKDPSAVNRQEEKRDRETLENAVDLQEKLQERMEQLAASIEQHPLFANLAEKARHVAKDEFAKAKQAMTEAEAADAMQRIQPLTAAAQQLAQANQKLADLEKQFDQIAQLEQDLLELNRLAANADQLADRLRDLERRKQQPAPKQETPPEQKLREEIQQAEEKQLLAQQQDLGKRADELLQRQPELQKSALQNQLNQLSRIAQKAQELAQPQRQVAESLQSAAKESANKNRELIQKQEDLQKQAKQLQTELALATPPQRPEAAPPVGQPPSDRSQPDQPQQSDPIDAAKLAQAMEALKAGNLGAAAKAEAELAERLEKLEQELRQQQAEKPASNEPAKAATNSEPKPGTVQKLEADQKPDAKQKSDPEQKPQAAQEPESADKADSPSKSVKPESTSKDAQSAEKMPPEAKPSPDKRAENKEPADTAKPDKQQAGADLSEKEPQAGSEPANGTPKRVAKQGPDPARVEAAAKQAGQLAKAARELQQKVEQAQQAQQAQSPQAQKAEQEKLAETLRNLTDQLQETQERMDRQGQKVPPAGPAKSEQSKFAKPDSDGSNSAKPQPATEPKPEAKNATTKTEKDAAGKAAKAPAEQPAGAEKSNQPPAGTPPQQAVKQAQAAMAEALKQLEQGNLDESATAGKKAADFLEQLGKAPASHQADKPDNPPASPAEASKANQANKTEPNAASKPNPAKPQGEASAKPAESQIPPAAANQVAEALNQLRNPQSSKPTNEDTPISQDKPAATAKQTKDKAEFTKASELTAEPGSAMAKETIGNTSGGTSGKPASNASRKSPPGGDKAGEGKAGESQSGTGTSSDQAAGKSSSETAGKFASGGTGAPENTAQPSATAGQKAKSDGAQAPASPLENAASQLQRASQALKRAAAQVQKPAVGSGQQAANLDGAPQAGEASADGSSQAGEGSGAGQGQQQANSKLTPDQSDSTDTQFEKLKRRMNGRKWGELSGTLQTEILQASQKKLNSEYGELIRQYFKEIAKSQPAASQFP